MKHTYQKRKSRNFKSFLNSNISLKSCIQILGSVMIGLLLIFLEIRLTGSRESIGFLFLFLGLWLSLVLAKQGERRKIQFLEQMEDFISNLQMYYGYYGDMEEAVYEAATVSKEKAYPLGKWLNQALSDWQAGKEGDNREETVRFYREQRPYVNLLYEICKSALRQETDGVSMQAALRRLKEEIREVCFKKKAMENGYRGLLEICLLTGFMLPLAKYWGASNLEELQAYYEEGMGRLFLLLCFVFSGSMFLLLRSLRFEADKRGIEKWLGKIPGCYELGKRILEWMERRLSLPWRRYKKKIEQGQMEPSEYYFCRICFGIVFFGGWLLLCGMRYIPVSTPGQFLIKGLFTGLLIGMAGSFLPAGICFFRRLSAVQTRMLEILRFYNWILLQRENPGCCLETLMEGFSELSLYLRKQTERLFYDYMQKGIQTLEEAREREMYMPFARILEGLILCDSVSMELAFGNFKTEREYYMEQLRREQEKQVQDSVALGKVLAFLPLYALMAFMLIIPFVTQGLHMLQSYQAMFI